MNNLQKIKSLNLAEMTLLFIEIEKNFGVEDVDAMAIRNWLLEEIPE